MRENGRQHASRRRRLRARPLSAVGVAFSALVLSVVPLVQGTAAAGTWWEPGQLQSWAYVIGENYPLTIPPVVDGAATDVQAVDSDLGDQDGLTASGVPVADQSIESSVSAVHSMGAHAICYVDAGTAEDWRSDYGEFDPSELGGDVPGWPGEEFINVADWSTSVPAPYESLQTIMTNRITLCKEEGFDAIEADNVDAYTDGNIGDFTLTMAQEEAYINELVPIAHGDGLAFFLKNEVNGDSLLSTEAPLVDGEIDEQCWQYSECSALDVFVQEGKPILNVEYQSFSEATLCPEALAFPMATIQAGVDLTGPINYGCWQYGATSATTTGATTATTAATTATTPTTAATTATTPTTAATTATTPTTEATTATTKAPTTTATTEPPTTSASTEPPTTAATTEPPTTSASTEPPTTTATTEPPTTSASTEPPTTTATTEPPTTSGTTRPPSTTETTGPPTTTATSGAPTTAGTDPPTSEKAPTTSPPTTATGPTTTWEFIGSTLGHRRSPAVRPREGRGARPGSRFSPKEKPRPPRAVSRAHLV